MIYCAGARVCVWDEGNTVEAAEKLDSQNGVMPGSRTIRKLGLNSDLMYEEL